MRLFSAVLIILHLHLRPNLAYIHIHIVATTNYSQLYQNVFTFLKQPEFEPRHPTTTIVQLEDLCDFVDELNLNLPSTDIVFMLYEGTEEVNPCPYKVHRESVNLLQFFNTSDHPSFAPEILLYTKFGKVRWGPYKQELCAVTDTVSEEIDEELTDYKPQMINFNETLRSIVNLTINIAQQSSEEIATDLVAPLREISEVRVLQELLQERQMLEETTDVLTMTNLFEILYVIMLIYALLFTFAVYPSRRLILKESMYPEDTTTKKPATWKDRFKTVGNAVTW
ncbi:unnamed protein product [Bursaphelenchus okinawaensis]|uniref:Uncharacterized protein n=1 Tax=Bursaphelenchus okinawaensis TaxID=465554 RepID=A0A811JUZ8_9BILA|nr:unnamed protein product [Bursaphelenchus okinawaensis]CAG9084193.1 unnamed protein product [Bursaphelenchus okinawaensis]